MGLSQSFAKWQDDIFKPHIAFETNYFMGSPTLDNTFVKAYFEGQFLNDTLKKRAINSLDNHNIFGAFNNFKISGTINTYKFKLFDRYYIGIENKNFMDLGFDKSLFELAFMGNKGFEGQELEFKNNHFSYIGYSQLKGGLIKTISNKRFEHSFALIGAVNLGHTLNSFYINKARLLTAENASFIDLTMDAEMLWAKNKTDKTIKIFNGFGGALDVHYGFICDKGNSFNLSIMDIGFIKWIQPHTTSMFIDTSMYFDGILIDNIMNLNTAMSDLNGDSIKQELEALTSKKSFTTYTPRLLQAYFAHAFNHDISMGIGIQMYSGLSYKNFYFLDIKYQVHPFILLSPHLNFGGYAKTHAGLDIVLNYKSYFCYIGTDYLTALFNKNTSIDKGFYFKLTRTIKNGGSAFFKPSNNSLKSFKW